MPNEDFQPGQPGKNVSQHTYEQVLALIETGDLLPGQILEERALAARMNVSRTPMRATLSRLLGEGIISRLSNGLLVVREIGLEEYLQLIQFRRLLEGDAAFHAATRIPPEQVHDLITEIDSMEKAEMIDLALHWQLDDRLHRLIGENCGNRWLANAIADVRRMARMCNVEKLPRRFKETCEEHRAILLSIEKRDGEAARENMRKHIDQVRNGFMNLLSVG
ncbi:GntR family transcriptional regulator [Phyllobacterium sp. SB3]|uniref:GntR family transcriptional regulator n=1 Tax=Phyllobacterium sp. SB3 TaxID=3156073 RepID=UPI0032AFBD2F